MEQLQRETWDFMQPLLDRVPDAVTVIDRNRRIVLANQATREMAGGKDPVAERLACHRLFHHSETPCQGLSEECPLTKVIQTKAPVTVMHTHYDAHGNETLVEVSAIPVLDAAGEVVEMIEMCRKIGERRPTIDNMRASLRLFQTAIRVAERELLETALKANGGNKTAAAASLGMKASTFRDKLTKYGL